MSESMATFQNAFYIGNNFNAILYGIELMLYFMTVRAMFGKKASQTQSRQSKTFLLFLSTALLCLNTIFVATEAVFGEEMWIVNADYAGGQDAYLNDFASVWYQTFGTAASIVLNLLSDGFLIYRCLTLWDDMKIVAFPIVLYIATFSIGLTQLYESGRPHANYFAGLAQQLGVAYTSCVISLNLLVSALICARIVLMGRGVRASAGAALGSECATVAAIVVESAALYALTGVAYLAAFARGSQTAVFFLSVYVMMTCIAPQMIILRVVRGRALTRTRDRSGSAMTGTGIEFTKSTQATTTDTHVELGVCGGAADADAAKREEYTATQQSSLSTIDVAHAV